MLKSGGSILDANPGSDLDAIQHATQMASAGSAVEYASASNALGLAQTVGFTGGDGALAAPASNTDSDVRITIVDLATDDTPGLLEVGVPRGTAGSESVLVIALPDAVVATARTNGAAVQVALRDGQELPSWVRYGTGNNTLILSAVPADGLPLSLRLTVGDMATVIELSETP